MECKNCGTVNQDEAKYCENCGAILSLKKQTSFDYAGFVRRFLAYIIDSIIAGLIFGALTAGISSLFKLKPTPAETNMILLLFTWLYYASQESSDKQATYGKRMVGIKVGNLEGERISFINASGRFWAKILSGLTLTIGYLMILFTSKKQGLHDKLAGTIVYKA